MWPESAEQKTPLRTGYTTGACATVCATAAAQLVLTGRQSKQVSIRLPKGQLAKFALQQIQKIGAQSAWSSVIKDAGDDPDITHGAVIKAQVDLIPEPGVKFVAGNGVGKVTRAGLAVAVGEPAINPVPRQMINEHLTALAQAEGYQGGFQVTISIEKGAELALKTMNPRLGIVGGLSVLGTTGIVRPFSCAAYIASIHQGIDVALTNGITHLAAATGNQSESYIQAVYNLPQMALIEMGDFVGALLKHLKNKRLAKLSICGGFGKISKLANGHMDLHSRAGAIDFDQLAVWAEAAGADADLSASIRLANTSIEAHELACAKGVPLAQVVCDQALKVAQHKLPQLEIEIWAVDRRGGLLAKAAGVAYEN